MLESYFIQTCGVQLLGVTASTEMRIPITLLFANFNIIVLGLMSTYSFQYKIWLVGKKITSVLHDDQISCSTTMDLGISIVLISVQNVWP